MEGFVIKSVGAVYDVWMPDEKKMVKAKLRGKLKLKDSKLTNPIAVGDWVRLLPSGADMLIEDIKTRKNYIIRKSPHNTHGAHILAANVDCAYLIVTPNHPVTSQGFIDRFLVSCDAFQIPAVVVFNKKDLWDTEDASMVATWQKLYQAIGYTTFQVSAHSGEGLLELKQHMTHWHMLLSGHSGVGKSALLNKLFGLHRKSQEISSFSNKGVHTTTFAEAVNVSFHSWITDTPGIKEFGLYDIQPEELSHFFPEMRQCLGFCKYPSCLHVNEPGCAVKHALFNQEISQSRYKSYLSMLEDKDLFR